MTVPTSELRQFVDRLLDGQALSKPESARLEELLEEPDALAYYVQVVQHESLLPHVITDVPAASEPAKPSARILVVRFAAMAAAACVMFLVGYLTHERLGSAAAHHSPMVGAQSPARITGLIGIEWMPGAEPDLVKKGGIADRLAFRTGLAELTYSNGVRVTIEGPADFAITGPNSARLTTGKLVAIVPKGAEGFAVDYLGGTVVDLGTEFALSTSPHGPTELGVFDGEVELHRPNAGVMSLTENQAVVVQQAGGEKPAAIPLDRAKFIRSIPTRDFRWEVNRLQPMEMEFDVSHLVWKAGVYCALFKWMHGRDGIEVKDVTLCLDGVPVVRNPRQGVSGTPSAVRDNLLELAVSPQQFRRGHWTVRATLQPRPLAEGRNLQKSPIYSLGVMQFEEGLVRNATAADFIGSWSYHHLGDKCERRIYADGTMDISINGELFGGGGRPYYSSRWTVENGVLKIDIPNANMTEEFVLRDRDTLIFVKNPYQNATRVEKVGN